MVLCLKTSTSNAGEAGSIPDQGTKTPHLVAKKPKHKKRSNILLITNSIKSLKMVHIKKKSLKNKINIRACAQD